MEPDSVSLQRLHHEGPVALFLADIGIPMTVYAKMGLDFVTPFDHRYRVPLTPA